MSLELMRRSQISWAVMLLVPGVILVLAAGLHWAHWPTPLASHSPTAMRQGATTTWREQIQNMDRALGQNAIQAAEANLSVARLEVIRSHTWEAWIGLGDAALRLGEATGSRTAYLPRARQAFRMALRIAQDVESQAGVLAAADRFEALGDQLLANGMRRLAHMFPTPGS
jgi:hypothetical protein